MYIFQMQMGKYPQALVDIQTKLPVIFKTTSCLLVEFTSAYSLQLWSFKLWKQLAWKWINSSQICAITNRVMSQGRIWQQLTSYAPGNVDHTGLEH